MSIESEAQKDLSLNDDDAENVTGGLKKKKQAAKKPAAHKAAGHSLPSIVVHTTVTPSSEPPVDDCDPGDADSGVQA